METKPIFRGKSLVTGKWLHGTYFYYAAKDESFILFDSKIKYEIFLEEESEVDPDTVSQGFYIDYECYFCGDIIEFESESRWIIVWKNDGFMLKSAKTFCGMHDYMTAVQLRSVGYFKVIGNEFDNPELMEIKE